MQEVKNRITQYDKRQKENLVVLGQGPKPYAEILSYLDNEIKMSTKMASFNHSIMCFKNDGVYQLNQAIEKIYGVSEAKDNSGPSSKKDMQTVDVILADGTRIKVPYGEIALPELGEGAYIDIAYNKSNNLLHITGSCQFRFSSMIDDIVDETKRLLRTNSIYKDQAIELGPNCTPSILDLSGVHKEFMVLSERTEYELRPLMSRVRRPEECIAKGIPLKTGILLEGGYGTGKTLLAFKVAQEAIKNGWSFIYLKEPELLAQTLRLSKSLDQNGNGVIVFLEDVDQVTRGDRDSSMQDILNTLDGGDTKNMNVIALFTTNHIELIEPTFLRGKRIGSVISMGHLDANTAKKFLTHSFQDPYTLEKEGLEEVCNKIAKNNIVPAFMAEIVETVKSNMIFEESHTVKASNIEHSMLSYLKQVALAQTKDTTLTAADKLTESLRKTLDIDSLSERIDFIHNELVS